MQPWFMLLMGALLSAPSDTTVVLGSHRADLTGDGEPELMQVVGVGASLDSLDVTLTIHSSDELLYSYAMQPMTRTVGIDAQRRVVSWEEHMQRLGEYGEWVFAESKFVSPQEFVAELSGSAPRLIGEIPDVIVRDSGWSQDVATSVWDGIREAGSTVFSFSPGGDALLAIAWSPAHRRFVRLIECC